MWEFNPGVVVGCFCQLSGQERIRRDGVSRHRCQRYGSLSSSTVRVTPGPGPADFLVKLKLTCPVLPPFWSAGAGEISAAVDVELVDVPEMGYRTTDKPYPRGEIRVRHRGGSKPLSGYWRNKEESDKVTSTAWPYSILLLCAVH